MKSASQRKRWKLPFVIAVMSCAIAVFTASKLSAQRFPDHPETRSAICPVIYSVDQSPGVRGYEYVFYGNAFFINEQGYLVTAAHVLSEVQGSAKPSIVVPRREAPPRLVSINIIATDRVRDIAILRAVPNPFAGRNIVSYLSLASRGPDKGEPVLAAALRPSHLRDPHSFDAPDQESDPGAVVDSFDEPLDKGVPPTEIFLFSHEVLRGQSGAPVLNAAGEVVGIVEGRWLHPTAAPSGTLARGQQPPLGAAIPITYVLDLLREKNIAWHSAPFGTAAPNSSSSN
jgi:S1-C subfamily serine protease